MADRIIVNSDTNRDAPDNRPIRRTAWGAVIAGALLALMTTLLLTLLFGGIGLNTFNPATSNDPVGNGTGSIIAVIVTNLVSLFLGGFVAGRLAGSPRRGDSIIHGLMTWGVLTLATIYLVSGILGSLVGGVSSLLGSTLSNAAQVAPAAANVLPNQLNVQNQINQFLTNAGVQNPQQTGQQLVQRIVQRVENGESLTSPAAQQELTTFLANNSTLSQQEINQQVQQFTQQADQTLQNVQNTVTNTAQTVTDTAGNVALWGLVGLILGAIVAALGAMAGAPKDRDEARA